MTFPAKKSPLLTIVSALAFSLLWAVAADAQPHKVDSLGQLLRQASDPARQLDLLQQLAKAAEQTDLQQSLDYIKQGVALAEKSGDKAFQPRFYEMEGRIYANTQRFDTASLFFEKALVGYQAVGDKKGEISAWLKKAFISRCRADFEQALQYDFKALPLAEGLKDEVSTSKVYEYISDDLAAQGKTEDALQYAQKAIELAEKSGDKVQLLYSYGAAGRASILKNDYQTFYDYADRAVRLARSQGIAPGMMAPLLNDRGNALKLLGRHEEALATYRESMELSEKTDFKDGVASALANIGDVYIRMGRYAEALPYQLQTIKMQEEGESQNNLAENYWHTSTIYEKLGDYRSSLAYFKKFKTAKDSLMSLEKDAKMSELLTQYETEKKEALIASQGQVIAQQKAMQYGALGVAALLLGLLLLLYRSFKAKQSANGLLEQSNKELGRRNAENELLLKEIHHRVKNNLQTISSLLNLQSASITDPNALQAVQESQSRVRSMALIHQKLYQGEKLIAVEMKDYLETMGETMLDAAAQQGRQIRFLCPMEKIELDVDTAIPIGLIANELVTNSLKYAFPGNRAGEIRVSLTWEKNEELCFRVADNGVGLSGEKDAAQGAGTGFGGRLVQLLTMQLGGKLEQSEAAGTSTTIRFRPLAKTA